LVIASLGLLFCAIEFGGEFYWIFTFIFYFLMVIETASTRTMHYLSNLVSSKHTDDMINNVRKNAPAINFKIQNYHYEWVTRHRGGKRETRRERVDTHFACEPFRYCEYIDISPDASAIEFVKMTRLARLNFGKVMQYTA
jgi:hypothetical protein